MYFFGKRLCSITPAYMASSLKDDSAFIKFFIDEVHCDATHYLSCFSNSLVNPAAIKTLATEFWKQCRMDVYYPVRKSCYQLIRDKQQKTCENNKISLIFLQPFEHIPFIIKVVPVENPARNMKLLCPANYSSIRFIAINRNNLEILRRVKMPDNILRIRS